MLAAGLLTVACAANRPATRVDGAVSSCRPGELLFAQSYLPSDLLPTPDGKSLFVVDWGFLALRDPETLAVQRFLLPTVDGWQSARFENDGRTIRAVTIDGKQYDFDTSTWQATRLPDVPVPEQAMWERIRHTASIGYTPSYGAKGFKADPQWTAAEACSRFGFDAELFGGLSEVSAAAFDSERREMVVGDANGNLFHLDLAGKRVIRKRGCSACDRYQYLEFDELGFIGVTLSGKLRLLDRALKVKREDPLLSPAPNWNHLASTYLEVIRAASSNASYASGYDSASKEKTRSVASLVRIPGTSRIAWLSRDLELGIL